MTGRLSGTVMLVALTCAPACRNTAPSGPPELRLGVDVCDGCSMTIAEARYAAAALTEESAGRRIVRFDDIGCLARWEANAPEARVLSRWVHDHKTEAWIDASVATFSRAPTRMTPMGSGIAAFARTSDADVTAGGGEGELSSWEAILARAREGSLQRDHAREKEAAR